ncbi:MAG: hypothetical protein HZB59_11905 [Ignavibacteriales bacterium]|nr:hypothetical protein [Ignavibacteriales bacterium]
METAKPFKQIEPDKLHSKQGGGCLSIFGLPFFAGGIFMILITAGVIPLENQNDVPDWGWIVMALMGIVFTVAGLTLTLGRTWVTIDVSRQVIQKYWGLLMPMRGEEISLIEFRAVEIHLRSGDSKTSDQFPVTLKMRAGKDFPLFSSTEYGKSYDQGTMIAKFIRLPLEDHTTDHPTTLAPDAIIDKSKELFDSTVRLSDDIPKPVSMQSRIEEIPDGKRITIPLILPKSLRAIEILIPLIFLIFIIPNLIPFFRHSNTPDAISDIFIAFIVLFFILIPIFRMIFAIHSRKKSGTILTLTSSQIVVEEKKVRRSRTKIIPSDEIIGIDYSTKQSIIDSAQSSMDHGTNQQYGTTTGGYPQPKWISFLTKFIRSKGITIKSKSGFYTFGAGLPDDEVLYLYSILKKNFKNNN